MHAGLHRRIFWSFGLAIAASSLLVWSLLHLTGGHGRVGMLLGAAVTLWAVSGMVAGLLVRPLVQVARVARAIGDGRLETRLELGRHAGELGLLSDAINDMAARIERQLADQRELLAQVSHEIRTPLGHMRILLETARDGAGGDGGATPLQVTELEREVLEIDRLVGQLLAGSRLDFGAVERRPIAAGEVAALALERAGLSPELLDVELSPADRQIDADPTLLGRALANLIDNAQGHGGGLTALRVRPGEAASGGGEVVFEAEDAGPGLPEGDHARLFERFYRGGAPDRAGRHGSLGLGLSLVDRIARAHGGQAFAEPGPAGTGARVGFSIGPSEGRPSSG